MPQTFYLLITYNLNPDFAVEFVMKAKMPIKTVAHDNFLSENMVNYGKLKK